MSIKVLGNKPRGLLFVISAPAGTGKSTLVNLLLKEFPDAVAESCSTTTRQPRLGEVSQLHYEFISVELFEERLKKDEFLEYAKVFGNYYGTPKHEVERLRASGKHVILVIDTQGAMQIKEKMSAIFIFISPPSLEELKNRLFKRRTESDEKIEERLIWAKHEMQLSSSYDYHIINENLDITYQVLKSIFIAEEHRRL